MAFSIDEAKEVLRVDGTDNDAVIQAICDALPPLVETHTGMSVARQQDNSVVKQVYGFLARKLYYADLADDLKLNRTIDSLFKIITVMNGAGGKSLIYKVVTENGIYKALAEDADGYSVVEVEIPEPVIIGKVVNANGVYSCLDDGADGYGTITVDVEIPETKLITKMITENGVYEPSDEGVDGYSDIAVNVVPNVGHKAVITNGTYYAEDDNLDGYSSIDVDIPEKVLIPKEIHENGTYVPENDGVDGYTTIVVNVENEGVVLIPKTIISQGTYNAADDGVDGYSSVQVALAGPDWDTLYEDLFTGSKIHIYDGATDIRSYLFAGITASQEIEIPASVRTIGASAFYSTSGVKGTVRIPTSVTSIGTMAFSYCGMTGLVFEEGFNGTINNSFSNCTKLETVEFADSMTTIPVQTFNGCTGIKGDLRLPASLQTIGTYAFARCSQIDNIIIPRTDGVVSLEAVAAFNNTKLASGTAYLYVPDELVDQYKVATNWTTYANQIKPLSEYAGGAA